MKKKLPKFYIVVDYNDKAKALCVGGWYNLRFFFYSNGALLGNPEIFSHERLKQFKKMRIPIIFRAKYDVPNECVEEPKEKRFFGVIKWREIL